MKDIGKRWRSRIIVTSSIRVSEGFKCHLKYVDKNQIVQVRVDRRCVTKMVEMILNSLPLEDGVLSLRCELRGTNCEAHITLMSSQDTVTVIDKLGKVLPRED